MIRKRADKYGELTDSELSEREEQRHAADNWPAPAVAVRPSASPLNQSSGLTPEQYAAWLDARIETLRTRFCCRDEGPDERGRCPNVPGPTGGICPLIRCLDDLLVSGNYLPKEWRACVHVKARNEFGRSEEGNRGRDLIESLPVANSTGSGVDDQPGAIGQSVPGNDGNESDAAQV